jgi:hypothetical protein
MYLCQVPVEDDVPPRTEESLTQVLNREVEGK